VLFDDHWTRRDPEVYERERGIVGDLERLDEPAKVVTIGTGGQGDEARAILEEIRKENPDDPFWRGVGSIEVGSDGVRVEFNDGVDPALRRSGGVDVACVLYGDGDVPRGRG
jgi:hypothetical protein